MKIFTLTFGIVVAVLAFALPASASASSMMNRLHSGPVPFNAIQFCPVGVSVVTGKSVKVGAQAFTGRSQVVAGQARVGVSQHQSAGTIAGVSEQRNREEIRGKSIVVGVSDPHAVGREYIAGRSEEIGYSYTASYEEAAGYEQFGSYEEVAGVSVSHSQSVSF